MRGWLNASTGAGAAAAGLAQNWPLWFVLSPETLSYYEASDSVDPLGMLGLDEVRSVKASKRSNKEYLLTITLSDERFEHRLVDCAAMLAEEAHAFAQAEAQAAFAAAEALEATTAANARIAAFWLDGGGCSGKVPTYPT